MLQNIYHYILLSQSVSENIIQVKKLGIPVSSFEKIYPPIEAPKSNDLGSKISLVFYENTNFVPQLFQLFGQLSKEYQEYAAFHTYPAIYSWFFYKDHFHKSADLLKEFQTFAIKNENPRHFVLLLSSAIFNSQLFIHAYIQAFQTLLFEAQDLSNDWIILNLLQAFWNSLPQVPLRIVELIFEPNEIQSVTKIIYLLYDTLFPRLLLLLSNVPSLIGHLNFRTWVMVFIATIEKNPSLSNSSEIVSQFLESKLKDKKFPTIHSVAPLPFDLSGFFSDFTKPQIFLTFTDLFILEKLFSIAEINVELRRLKTAHPVPEQDIFAHFYIDLNSVKGDSPCTLR